MNFVRINQLNEKEFSRLKQAIRVALSFPLIDDLEDYVWEAVFAYMKNLPINHIRDKRLFDVVDVQTLTGWSAKSLQWNIYPECEFELVIQRADIFKKSHLLGFEPLSLQSEPNTLGLALLQHWRTKVEEDAQFQNIERRKLCFLLKNRDRQKFAYYEDDIRLHHADTLTWRWTDESKTGLQGLLKTSGFCVYRWYPNQKQLFERFILPAQTEIFDLNISRLTMDEVIPTLLSVLDKH